MPRSLLIGAGGALALVLLVVVLLVATRDETIADGVRVGTVDVGGLQRDEARDRVRRGLAASAPAAARVAVVYRDRHFVLRPAVARARLDADATVDAALDRDAAGVVSPRLTFSRAALNTFAARLAKRVDRPARNADIDWHDGKLERTHARSGVQVQRAQLAAALGSTLANPAAPRSVKLPVRITERPDRTLTDLAKRYPTVIAVDRDSKQLRLYKALQLEHKYKIAVGKAGLETSAGRYEIQEKIVNPDWHVPNSDWAGDLAGRTIPAGDPQNPLEARYMGFHDGEGIHGTAELGSLGAAASHGCIRMAVPDVKQLFRQVKVGTPVFIQ